jgi:hypothetical protein
MAFSHVTFPWWLAAFARFSRLVPNKLFDGVRRKPED